MRLALALLSPLRGLGVMRSFPRLYARANKSVASRLARVNREASVLWQALRWVPETSALDRDAGAAELTDGPDFQLFFGAAGEQEGAIVEVVSAVESTLGR